MSASISQCDQNVFSNDELLAVTQASALLVTQYFQGFPFAWEALVTDKEALAAEYNKFGAHYCINS